jgi:hypothetical protein
LTELLEEAQLSINNAAIKTAKNIFELAIKADSLGYGACPAKYKRGDENDSKCFNIFALIETISNLYTLPRGTEGTSSRLVALKTTLAEGQVPRRFG